MDEYAAMPLSKVIGCNQSTINTYLHLPDCCYFLMRFFFKIGAKKGQLFLIMNLKTHSDVMETTCKIIRKIDDVVWG